MKRAEEAFDLVEAPAPNEGHLQGVMLANPQLIPAEDLGLDGDLLVIGRETRLASGSIDLVCLSHTGELVLIEFKTGPQNPDFRHALAQLIDYGSDLWGMSNDDLDNGVVQRYLSSSHCVPSFAAVTSLREAVDLTSWNMTDDDWESLSLRLAEVLATGDFHFVVAAQRFTPTMVQSLDYLNATVRHGRYHLLQLVLLQGSDFAAYSAQMVAGPSKASVVAGGPTSATTSEAEFLARIDGDEYREAMIEILSSARTLGLVLAWGSKGTSIRLSNADRNEPLSIGWAFLEGDQWSGARHLTLGVDNASMKSVPSLLTPIESFKSKIKSIEGAKPVRGKLDAWMFEPAAVPTVKTAIIDALTQLVADATTEE